MRDKMFIALLAFLLCVSAKGQSLEQAFTEISCMEGFQMSDCSAEEYGYPKEIGRMRMTMRGNSDSRDEVLAVLSKIPKACWPRNLRTKGERRTDGTSRTWTEAAR